MNKLYYLLPSIIVYACFAFVALELNPLQWDGVARAFFVIILAIANWVGFYIYCELQNEEERREQNEN